MMENELSGELSTWDDDFTDPWARSDGAVLQHGFCRNGNLWRPWVPYLGRTCRVLRPDLPGSGRSRDAGPDVVHTTERFVAQTLALLDQRDIERVHYVGEGIGGAIGAAFAGEHPDRVASLTLISEPVTVDPNIQRNHAVGFPTWQEAIATLGTRAWWLKARASANDLTGDAAVDGYIADEVGRTPPHVAVAISRWATTWDLAELLPKVQVPVLFIWAEGAHFVDQAGRDEITALPADGRQRIIPGVASQILTYTHPDAIAPVVADFIRDAAGAAG